MSHEYRLSISHPNRGRGRVGFAFDDALCDIIKIRPSRNLYATQLLVDVIIICHFGLSAGLPSRTAKPLPIVQNV